MTTQAYEEVAVVIDFLKGNFQEGFQVSLEIFRACVREHQIDELPLLPSAPELPILYRTWRSRYTALGGRHIQAVPDQFTHSRSAVQDCRAAALALEQALKLWFQDASFKYLRAHINAKLLIGKDDSVPVIFNFRVPEADQLRRLPWHVWDLFRTDWPNAEVVLQGKVAPKRPRPEGPLQVLAIYGSATGGINTEDDRAAWRSLKNRQDVTIKELNQPKIKEFRDTLTAQTWDILFFAGHSSSSPTGQTGTPPTGTLQIGKFADGRPRLIAIAQLKEDLRRAVKSGLKLAIFNSCDGLGIADVLTEIEVPTAIVMREPVVDLVARRFIQVFLQNFSQHHQFYRAVRTARRELNWLENDFYNPLPSATWLPIVLQNPSQPALQWPRPPQPPRQVSKPLPMVVGTVVFVTLLLSMSVRYIGRSSPLTDGYGSSLTADFASIGGKVLTPKSALKGCDLSARADAAAQMKAGRYDVAYLAFKAFSDSCPTDPEAQIYQHNAGVLKDHLTSGTSFLKASTDDLTDLHQNAVIIAVPVPLRGNKTDVAQEILRGAAQAQQRVNQRAEAIAPSDRQHSIIIEIVNDDTPGDRNLSDAAYAVAEQLVRDPAVFAVIGHYSSGATNATAGIYEQARVVAVSPTSTAIRKQSTPDPMLALQAIELSDHIFRISPSDQYNANVMVKDIKREGVTNVLIAYDQEGQYSRSLKATTVRALEDNDITVSHICNFSQAGGFKADSCLDQATHAQALLFLPSADVKSQASDLLAAAHTTLPIWAGDAAYSSDNFSSWGNHINGARVAIPWHAQSPYNDGTIFAPTEEGNSWRSAMAYDALQVIAEGLSRQLAVSPHQPNREKLRAVLADPNFNATGIAGKSSIQFNAWGDRLANQTLTLIVEVVPKEGGGYCTRPIIITNDPTNDLSRCPNEQLANDF